mmetsp:Transcript_6237/g.21924  ORF Transcript_6237/g.21924 Transcript_6237/m.21924 type:complete len:305 (+) Transcript_6237:741-1655(+)
MQDLGVLAAPGRPRVQRRPGEVPEAHNRPHNHARARQGRGAEGQHPRGAAEDGRPAHQGEADGQAARERPDGPVRRRVRHDGAHRGLHAVPAVPQPGVHEEGGGRGGQRAQGAGEGGLRRPEGHALPGRCCEGECEAVPGERGRDHAAAREARGAGRREASQGHGDLGARARAAQQHQAVGVPARVPARAVDGAGRGGGPDGAALQPPRALRRRQGHAGPVPHLHNGPEGVPWAAARVRALQGDPGNLPAQLLVRARREQDEAGRVPAQPLCHALRRGAAHEDHEALSEGTGRRENGLTRGDTL